MNMRLNKNNGSEASSSVQPISGVTTVMVDSLVNEVGAENLNFISIESPSAWHGSHLGISSLLKGRLHVSPNLMLSLLPFRLLLFIPTVFPWIVSCTVLDFSECSTPVYRDLQNNLSVKSDDRDIMVHPKDVMDPPIPGPVVLLVDCPTSLHLKSLLSVDSLDMYYTDYLGNMSENAKEVNCVIHLSPSSISSSPDYQKWMKRFGHAQHIMAGHEQKNVEIPILIASARVAARLNYLCPQFFPASGFWPSHIDDKSLHSNSSTENQLVRGGRSGKLGRNSNSMRLVVDNGWNKLFKISAILLRPSENNGQTSLRPGDISVIYACELPKIQGKFHPEKAKALGLRAGPRSRRRR